ncbi:thioredoxin-like domain protein, partial [Klebsiella pneumoniae]|nr:thioredoxin-like domain protein [Klebsiella pneumoniae]
MRHFFLKSLAAGIFVLVSSG